jgi:hypothetical protein
MASMLDSVPALRDESVNQPPTGAAAHKQLGSDRGRDHHDQNDCGDPDTHGK